jgi:hypothetical protein
MTMTHEPQATTRADGSPTLAARGYSWPAFEDANTASLVHGAQSPRVLDAAATVLAEAVVTEAPWLEAEIFQPAIWRYARAEARARLLSNYILQVADEHPEKIGARLWESANGADNTASKMAEALGLTPLSRARLAAIVTSTEATTQGLDVLAERGRAIRQRRDAALQPPDTETTANET